MKNYFFNLNIGYADCESLYSPNFNTCLVTDVTGKRIQLPTMNLRPFVTKNGIKGRFKLTIDENNKLKSFEKIQ